jgi:hypothetical protein
MLDYAALGITAPPPRPDSSRSDYSRLDCSSLGISPPPRLDYSTLGITAPPPRPRQRTEDVKLQTPPKIVFSNGFIQRPPTAPSSRIGVLQRPCLDAPSTVKTRKRRRLNQKPKTPVTRSRRKPKTAEYSPRSSRHSPPRFGSDNAVAQGSPRSSQNLHAAEGEDLDLASQPKRRLDFGNSGPDTGAQLGGFGDDYEWIGNNGKFDAIVDNGGPVLENNGSGSELEK